MASFLFVSAASEGRIKASPRALQVDVIDQGDRKACLPLVGIKAVPPKFKYEFGLWGNQSRLLIEQRPLRTIINYLNIVLDISHAWNIFRCDYQGLTVRFGTDRTPKLHYTIFNHDILAEIRSPGLVLESLDDLRRKLRSSVVGAGMSEATDVRTLIRFARLMIPTIRWSLTTGTRLMRRPSIVLTTFSSDASSSTQTTLWS